MTSGEIAKSKYNSAQLDLFRLNNLWQKSHYYAEKGLLQKWNTILDRIYQELSNDTNEEDDKVFDKYKEKIKKIPRDELNSIDEMYNLLNLKERFLRKLQNKQGKGTSYDDYDYGIT